MSRWIVSKVARGAVVAAMCIVSGCSVGQNAAPSPSPTVVTPPPTSTIPHPRQVIAQDTRSLKATSYTPIDHVTATMPDGTVLVVFHSLCTGSADGHCQAIDVFRNRDPRAIWHRQYVGVKSVHVRSNGFSVVVYNYAPQDPLCCPSLPPVTDVYVWNGSKFREFGPTARQPGA